MEDPRLRKVILDWRKAQDSLYASVMNAPSLYMACIRLVRETANRIADVADVEGLLAAHETGNPDLVGEVADELDVAQLDYLDFGQVRDAAFYLRYQEIRGESNRTEFRRRVAEARQAGAQWVVLHEETSRARGRSYPRRMEMHLPDGAGLYTGAELDLERGRVYVVEPMRFDPETGEPLGESPTLDPRQEFATQEEMIAAAEALRAKYASRGGETESS